MIQNRGTDADYDTENPQSPQYVDIFQMLSMLLWAEWYDRDFFLRLCISYYSNIMLKLDFTLPVQFLVCIWSDIIWKWFFFSMLYFTGGWFCLTTNNYQSIKTREIMFAALEGYLKTLSETTI